MNENEAIWAIVFADEVGGLTPSNFALVNSGLTGPSITSVGPQGVGVTDTQWNISVNTGTGDGTLGINLVNATGLTPGISTTLPYVGEVYTVDKSIPASPVITGSTPGSPNNSSVTPTINGTAEADSFVSVFTTSDCTTGLLQSAFATGGNFAIGVTVPANATTSMYARAMDAAGNISPCSGSFSYTHDDIPAVTTIDIMPPLTTSSTDATFEFNGSQSLAEGSKKAAPDVALFTFECQLDGGGYSACTSPKTYTGLSVAHHTFNVRAIDPAGNADATPATYEWDVVAVCVTPPANMTTWFKGEGNAHEVFGTHGTLVGNATATASGIVGQSFGFDGSGDYVTTPDNAKWDLTGDFTIDAWINPVDGVGTERIISAGNENQGAFNLWTLGYGNNGAWGGGQRLNFAYWAPGYVDINSNAITLNPGQWYHVALVRTGGTYTYYLDGVAVGSGSITTAALNGGTTGAIIGARYDQFLGIAEFANGKQDEIELFNRALSAGEIQSIYAANSLGKCYSPGTVEFTAANFNDTELNSSSHTATVTVTRTGGSYGTAAVAYTTGDGTATLADNDYVATSGTVTWADGETGSKNILVTVNGDTTIEPNETINMSFTTVFNAAMGPQATSTVTIVNDDANPPTVTTNAATLVTATTATLNGTGNPNGESYLWLVPLFDDGPGNV
ncbi:MAG: hypothetical protein IPI64_10475 [Chloracidobacterium sp.]|nr:hypothetical protein [Chloracidobacterium sp.]